MRSVVGLALVPAILAASLLGLVVQGQETLAAIIEGPPAVRIGATETYNVTVTGGPGAAGGNVTVQYYLTGSDLTGARPTQSAPGSAMAQNATTVTLNVTAPTRDQVVTLVAEVNSSKGASFEVTTATKGITVLTPIELTATFRNTATVAAVNVSVAFSVDGSSAGTTTIRRIEPGSTGAATVFWLPVGLAAGCHTVTATADLNRDGRIDPEVGEVQTSSPFCKSTPDLPWAVIIIIVGGLVFVGFVANSAIKRRRQRGA